MKRKLLCEQCDVEIFVDTNMVMLKEHIWENITENKKEVYCDHCIESKLGRPIEISDLKESVHSDMIPCNVSWMKEKNPNLFEEYQDGLSKIVVCIGKGREGEGCGYVGGKSGYACPKCNGMLLSKKAIREAEETIKHLQSKDSSL